MMQVYSTLNENITALPSALQEALSPLTIPNLKLTMLPIVLARRPREDDEEDLNENEDDLEDSDEEEAIHVAPTVRGTQNNGNESAEEDVDWLQPPPPPTSLPPLPSLPTIPTPITLFKLGMSLSFYNGTGQTETVVYEGVIPDGLTHTVQQKDGT